MIDLEILRRKAKRGISFPKQTPQYVELFGVRCLAIGFYRGDERCVLFIAEKPTPKFHNGHNIFEFISPLQNCCYELPFTGQVDLGTALYLKSFMYRSVLWKR